MTVPTPTAVFPAGDSAWTRVQAERLLRLVEDMFHRRDVEALVNGFAEDCVFRFAEQPEQRGRQALRRFFTARFARQKDYRLRRAPRRRSGSRVCAAWGEVPRSFRIHFCDSAPPM